MEDVKIIELYWDRDESAIEETSKKYGAYCFSIANSILENSSDSEECVNDVYMKVWTSIPPQRPTLFDSFLGTITRNLSLDRYRRRSAEKRGGGNVELALDELRETLKLRDESEKIVESVVLGDLLNRFLREIKPEAKAVFIRRYWMFSPTSAIARDMGIGESKVKMILSRTRKKLSKFLETEGYHYGR